MQAEHFKQVGTVKQQKAVGNIYAELLTVAAY